MARYLIGLDLGQARDFTAITILEQLKVEGIFNYHVRHLNRVRGEDYPSVIDKTTKMVQSLRAKSDVTLVLDQTGCGRPVFDMFEKAKLKPIGVNIHGGDATTHDGNCWRVPKRDLVGVLQVLLQSGRLKVAAKLELGSILQEEMLNFKVKIDPATAHDSYSAWREADHDDLVLSVALAAWYGEQFKPQVPPRLTMPKIDPIAPAYRIGPYMGVL